MHKSERLGLILLFQGNHTQINPQALEKESVSQKIFGVNLNLLKFGFIFSIYWVLNPK